MLVTRGTRLEQLLDQGPQLPAPALTSTSLAAAPTTLSYLSGWFGAPPAPKPINVYKCSANLLGSLSLHIENVSARLTAIAAHGRRYFAHNHRAQEVLGSLVALRTICNNNETLFSEFYDAWSGSNDIMSIPFQVRGHKMSDEDTAVVAAIKQWIEDLEVEVRYAETLLETYAPLSKHEPPSSAPEAKRVKPDPPRLKLDLTDAALTNTVADALKKPAPTQTADVISSRHATNMNPK